MEACISDRREGDSVSPDTVMGGYLQSAPFQGKQSPPQIARDRGQNATEMSSRSQIPCAPMRNLTSGTSQSLPSGGLVYPLAWQEQGPILTI